MAYVEIKKLRGFFDFHKTLLYFHLLHLILPINQFDQDFLPLDFIHEFDRNLCKIVEYIVSIKMVYIEG